MMIPKLVFTQLMRENIRMAIENSLDECGCCGMWHPKDWSGDCRDDDHRVHPDDMAEALFDTLTKYENIINAMYIEDCHVSGMHDPEHTPSRVCDIQMRDLASRVLKAALDFPVEVYGKGWSDITDDERLAYLNQIPRKINRQGWYDYYVQNNRTEKRKELEDWERNGIQPRTKPSQTIDL